MNTEKQVNEEQNLKKVPENKEKEQISKEIREKDYDDDWDEPRQDNYYKKKSKPAYNSNPHPKPQYKAE